MERKSPQTQTPKRPPQIDISIKGATGKAVIKENSPERIVVSVYDCVFEFDPKRDRFKNEDEIKARAERVYQSSQRAFAVKNQV